MCTCEHIFTLRQCVHVLLHVVGSAPCPQTLKLIPSLQTQKFQTTGPVQFVNSDYPLQPTSSACALICVFSIGCALAAPTVHHLVCEMHCASMSSNPEEWMSNKAERATHAVQGQDMDPEHLTEREDSKADLWSNKHDVQGRGQTADSAP